MGQGLGGRFAVLVGAGETLMSFFGTVALVAGAVRMIPVFLDGLVGAQRMLPGRLRLRNVRHALNEGRAGGGSLDRLVGVLGFVSRDGALGDNGRRDRVSRCEGGALGYRGPFGGLVRVGHRDLAIPVARLSHAARVLVDMAEFMAHQLFVGAGRGRGEDAGADGHGLGAHHGEGALGHGVVVEAGGADVLVLVERLGLGDEGARERAAGGFAGLLEQCGLVGAPAIVTTAGAVGVPLLVDEAGDGLVTDGTLKRKGPRGGHRPGLHGLGPGRRSRRILCPASGVLVGVFFLGVHQFRSLGQRCGLLRLGQAQGYRRRRVAREARRGRAVT